MKLAELNKQYQRINIHEMSNYILLLEVKMPSGEIESIVNPNIPEKIKYINEAYDENLCLKKYNVIRIIDFMFIKNDEEMDFGGALDQLKDGNKVARKGWNGKGMYLELQLPTEMSKMTLPYVYMKTAQGDLVPWLASQTDVLSEDWIVIE